jgi:subtilase family serine protease/flagellar hook assembly protein FlgD/Tol biopolymer transport system component
LRACLAVLLAGTSSLSFADTGNVTVLEVDPGEYTATSGVSFEARREVAQDFFAKNSDTYDFLVVFPGFDTILREGDLDGLHTVGLHTLVRNSVKGIGKPGNYDIGFQFHSPRRLKGYIDIGTLRPASPTKSDSDALQILAHEVAHQWSGEAGQGLGLVGKDGAHWSFFLSSDASVLLGSAWRDNKDATPTKKGTFTAVESRRRYSPLDLYLMGFMTPEEVPPFQLLTPASGVSYSASDLPPAAGTTIEATPATLEVKNLISMLGQRNPTAADSPRDLRAAFILLVPRGQAATPAQLAHVERARAAWANQFFFLTRGRAFMQTERVDRAPTGSWAGEDAGLQYLLTHKTGVHWRDHEETAVRETEAALAALAFFEGKVGVSQSVEDAADWLTALTPKDGDERARRLRGLVLAWRPDAVGTVSLAEDADPLGIRWDGGRGYAPGYGATVLDTALVGLALTETSTASTESEPLKSTLAGLESYLLAHQNGDGGWPALAHGPSRLETTARVLQFLARRPRTSSDLDPISTAARAAFTYLSARRGLDGLYRDDLDLPSTTAEVVLALQAWGELAAQDGADIIGALQAQQLVDGSWEGSVYQTARVLQVLRLLQVPNLSISNVKLSASSVREGEGATVDVLVRNTGFVASGAAMVQAVDSNQNLFGSPQPLPELAPGATASVRLLLDTSGHVGSTQLFVVVDPSDAIDEMREDDNRVARAFAVKPAPSGVDLFVVAGRVMVTPERVSHLPQTLQVNALVGNAGLTKADGVVVSVSVGETVLNSTTLNLAAQAKDVPVSLPVVIQGGPYPVELKVRIEQGPGASESEAWTGNNSATLNVAAETTVGLQVGAIQLPGLVNQNDTVPITFDVSNTGTTEAVGARVAVRVVAADGVSLATLSSALPSIPSGQAKHGSVSWKATHAGTYTMVAQAIYLDSPRGSEVTATLNVTHSEESDLELGTDAISTSPQQPLVGKQADIHVRVRNAGAPAGSFKVDFYLGNTTGTPLGSVTVAGLGAGQSQVVTLPFTPATAEKQLVSARVNGDGQVPESNTGNNTTAVELTPLSIPDLVLVEGDILPSNAFPKAGDVVSVTVSVYNRGQQPSLPARVDLYLGAPKPGDGNLIGHATLAVVEAGARGQVVIPWSTSGLSGTQTLVAIVNRDGVVPEQSTGNNRAERDVLMQSGAVALTEPYISPNRDGVKDSTEVFYRLPSAGPSTVLVTARDGTQQRKLEVPESSAPSVSVSWDGRDEAGRVVKDGEYRLIVLAGASGAQVQLGAATVVVDTNGTRIDEIEDPAMIRHAFLQMDGASPTAMPDETGFAYFKDGTLKPCGFYYQSFLGGEPELIAPGGERTSGGSCYANDYTQTGEPFRFAMSPEGSSTAFIAYVPASGTQSARTELRRISRGDTAPTTLVGSAPYAGYSWLVEKPIRFQEDSQRVWFIWGGTNTSYSWVFGQQIHSIDVHNPLDRRVEVSAPDYSSAIYDFKPSQATRQVAFHRWNPSLRHMCLYTAPLEGYTYATPVECQRYMYQGVHYDWVDDGKSLLYAREILEFVGELSSVKGLQLVLYDRVSGKKKTLLEPPHNYGSSLEFATSPRGDAAVYALDFDTFNGDNPLIPRATIGLLKPVASGTPKVFAHIPGVKNVGSLNWSPRGTFLHGEVKTQDGASPYWVMYSLANLQAKIQASRPPGSSAISFRGTATDLNFDSYTIAVRPLGSTSEPVVVAQRRTPVVDAQLATWNPPSPDLYEVILTVKDKAGNSVIRTTKAIWSNAAASIANLSAEPVIFSPNGDGILDTARVRYEARSAIPADFSVTNASGVTVRTFEDRPHEEVGWYEFDWDGRKADTTRVDDGEYVVSAERASTGLVVDTKSPVVRLALGQQLPRPAQQSIFISKGATFASAANGSAVEIPSVQLWVASQTEELHPEDEKLEAVSGPDSVTIARSGAAKDTGEVLWYAFPEEVRGGRLRIRARDRAGNTGLSPQVTVPERLFLTGIGEASTLESGGTLRYDGRTIPRIDLLRRVDNQVLVDELGIVSASTELTPSSFIFKPQRYAFALANTVGAPIVSYAVSYPSPVTGAQVVDHANVEMLAEDAIVWDARALPVRTFDLHILATDATGQVFSTRVPFVPGATVNTCMRYEAGLEEATISTRLARGAPGDELLAPGAMLEFIPYGDTLSEVRVPVSSSSPIFDKDILYVTRVPTRDLTKCLYTVAIHGKRTDGSEVEGAGPLNVCGLINAGQSPAGSQQTLSLIETFRKPIQFVDVFAEDGTGHSRLVTTLRGFEGQSAEVAIPPLSCGERKRLRFVTHLSDGTVLDSSRDEQSMLRLCDQREFDCSNIGISVKRHADAAVCHSQSASYDVTVNASTDVAGGWQKIEAWLVTPTEARVAELPLSLTQTPSGTVGSGSVATAALPEGELRVEVKATTAKGTSYRRVSVIEEGAVFVDRTPVQFTLSSPSDGDQFCPEVSNSADGTQGRSFDFKGLLSDQWLERAALELQPSGSSESKTVSVAGEQRPRWVFTQGSFGKMDAAQLPPGTYTLTGFARDASGGSVCLAPRTFYVSDGINLDGPMVDPAVFGPLGTVKTTQVHYTLDAPGEVTLYAVSAGGVTSVVRRFGKQGAGAHDFVWDGSVVEGSTLSDGRYTLRVEAVDACGRKAAKSMQVVFDKTLPVARIDAPAAGTQVGSVIQVTGQATDTNFQSYTLSFEESTAAPFESSVAATGVLGTVSTAGLADGEHTLVLTVTDQVGLTREAKVKVQVAAESVIAGFSLTPDILSPIRPGAKVVGKIVLRQAAKVELQIDAGGGPLKTLYGPILLDPGPIAVELPSTLFVGPGLESDGDYNVKLVATVEALALTETAVARLALDRTPPVLAVTAPQAGGRVPGHGDVVGSVSDPHLTQWSVTYGLTGAGVEIGRGHEAQGGSSTLAQLEGLPDGEQRIVFTATDGAGNSDSLPVSFFSDSTPPRVSFLYPLAGEYLSSTDFTGSKMVGARVSGDDLSQVKLSAKRGTTSEEIGTIVPPVEGDVELPWSLATEGAVTLVWTATDLAGNSARAEIPVVVDNTAPTATITSVTIGSSSLKLNGNASDTNLESYKLELASGSSTGALLFSEIATGTVSTSGALAELPVLPADGVYTARLTVRDRAGNKKQSSPFEFTVDTRPPTPPVLSASVKPGRHVELSWTASSDVSGIQGYWVKRATGGGAFMTLNSTLITPTTRVDDLTANGTYRYIVVAVDQTGLESQPSNEVYVDVNPPVAFITRPAKGAVVSGRIEVVGSAYAVEDFKEYRLLLGEGAAPTAFTRVLSSSQVIASSTLGSIDLSQKPQGSSQTLRLEAEDTHGNVTTANVTVTVDNLAPSSPQWVSVGPPSGSTVPLSWKDNPEPDLAGYLLFRNGVLVNAPSGSSPGELTADLLTSKTYSDQGVPDGTFTYELQAMDKAGNLSALSEPKSVHLDAHTPVATLVYPLSMARLSGTVGLEAKVSDFDVTQVRFEARAGSETTFTALGVVTSPPFTLEFDPADFSSEAVEVRAVATDASGNFDQNPVSAYYFRDASPLAPVPVLRAAGYNIHVGWTDPNPAGKVVGYLVTRNGGHLQGSNTGARPISETVIASSTGSGTAGAAYDGAWSTPWVSAAPAPQRWEMQLHDAVLVSRISADSATEASGQKADLWVKVRGLWVRLAQNQEPSVAVSLNPPLEVQAVAYAFTQSPSGKVGLKEVLLDTPPFVTGPLPRLDVSQLFNNIREYTVTAVSPFGLTTNGKESITTLTPRLQTLASNVVPIPSVVVKGFLDSAGGLPPSSTIRVFRNQSPAPVLVAEGSAGWDGKFEVTTPLVQGENTLFVRANYPADNISADSAPLKVTYLPPPEVSITLSSPASSGSGVSFLIAVDGVGLSSVTGYRVRRVLGTAAPVIIPLPASPTPSSFSEDNLSNGFYRYTVVAVDANGFESTPSNTLLIEVKVPPGSEVPEAPRLTAPTRAGSPLTVATPVNTISGVTSPGTTVELFVNGRSAGTVTPEDPAARVVSTTLQLKNPPSGDYSLSNDGRAIAYRFTSTTSSGSMPAIAVEDLTTHEVQVLTLSEVQFSGTPFLSPDKSRVAITATCSTATGALCNTVGKAVLLVGEVASNTWWKVTATSPEFITTLAWSLDSARLAYTTIKDGSGPMLAVGSMAEPERILSTFMCGGWPASAAWTGNRRVVAIANSSLLEWDIDKTNATDPCDPSSRRTLLSASSIEYNTQYSTLVVSPGGTRILVQANVSGSGAGLYLVDTTGATPTRLLSSSGSVSSAAFSWDLTRVAYKAAGQLMIQALDTSGSVGKPVGAFGSTGQLLWPSGDNLFQFNAPYAAVPPSRLDWGVPFTFTDVTLARGPNRLVALARDLSGSQSPSSAPIEVFFDATRLPDLSIVAAVQPEIPRQGQPANAAITVKNGGGSPVSGVKVAVSVLGSDGSIRPASTVTLAGTLAPGATSAAFVPINLTGLSGGQELVAVVDPERRVQESDRGNNQALVPFVIAGDKGIAMGVQLSRRTLEADDTTTAKVTVVNAGAATPVTVDVELLDEKGARVRTLGPSQLFSPLDANASKSFTRSTDALGLLAGTYKVMATARVAGTVISTAHALLEILPDQGASLALSPSRSKYIAGEPIDLMARVVNLSSNALLTGAMIALEVKDAEGVILETLSLDLQAIAPGASTSPVVLLATRPPPGTYRATAVLRLDESVLASDETSLVVEGRVGVQGAVAVVDAAGVPPVVPSGEDASVLLKVKNDGTAPAGSLVVFVRVVDEGVLPPAVVRTEQVTVGTLAPGASWTHTLEVPTTGLVPRTHAVSLTATWAGAEETSLSSTSFRVGDTSVPVITSANLSNGMFVQGEVLASLQVVDGHSGVASVRALVDGTGTVELALVPGTTPQNGTWRGLIPLGTEGPHLLRFTAVDKDGNDGASKPVPGNPLSITVVRDTQRPGIAISGVEDGEFYASVVSPVVVVSDANLSGAVITLDGVPFVPGTSVGADGTHRLQVEAHDKAGNSSSENIDFVVDRSEPVISVMGVSDGAILAGPVTPVVEVVDSHLATKSILLDGHAWVPGTAVTARGSHLIEVEATDRAGNSSSVDVSFVIDDELPTIEITGVVDGGFYQDAVMPVVTISDTNLVSSSVKLDGVDFVSGTQVRADGWHTLVAEAWDAVGHHRQVVVSFRVRRFTVQVAKGQASFGFARALALVGSGKCVPPPSEVSRLSDYLSAELQQAGGILKVTSDEDAFKAELRSGRFNLIILASARAYDHGCSPNTSDSSDVCHWVAERVYSGNAGLIAINPSSFRTRNPCWEVLGVSGDYSPSSRAVVGWEGPLGPQGDLQANEFEEVSMLQLDTGPAIPAAWYGSSQSGEVAVATHAFGEGRSVSFGFDPGQATPSTTASEIFQSAMSWVHPSPAEHLPLGVIPVELRVGNLSSPVDVRVREQLAPELSAILTEPLSPSLEWTYSLDYGERAFPHYLVRLPDAVGEYVTTTRVEVLLPDGPWLVGSRTFSVEVERTGDALFTEARAVVETVSTEGQDGVFRSAIEDLLNQVQTRPVVTAADAEANLRDLYQAAGISGNLSTVSPVQMRLALDRLIIYWEARWSAL